MPTIALSTAEAELGALVRGAAEGDGIKALLQDFGLDTSVSHLANVFAEKSHAVIFESLSPNQESRLINTPQFCGTNE